MTDLDSFSSALSAQIRADARNVVVPPVARLQARARRRRTTRAAGAALAVLAVLGAGVVVADGLPGGSRQGLIADAPAETVLDSGVDDEGPWQLVARREGRCILLVRARSEGGACDLSDPPRLDEMTVSSLEDRGATITLVAGIVPDGTTDVQVAAAEGDAVPARVLQVAGDTYYAVRLPGATGVRSVVALDGGGRLLDRFEGMPVPPPPDVAPPGDAPTRPNGAVKAPPPNRIAETDEFGVLVALRETPQGLEVDVNRVDMLGGQEARDEAAARGEDYANDYFLVDDNPMLRTYLISPDVEVWGSLALGVALEGERATLSELRAHVDEPRVGFSGTLFHLDVEDGLVVGIEEQYRP